MTDRWWCRLCEEAKEDFYCPKHPSEDLQPVLAAAEIPDRNERPHENERDADRAEDAPRTDCWQCGHHQTDARNDICEQCKESLEPPVLLIDFPEGAVVLRERGTSAELGRAGEYGRLFAAYPNVSRRHASVSVDAAGDAWLTPYPEAPNGTFVNEVEIMEKRRLQPGDRIRFATDGEPPVSGPVRQPYQEGVTT
jgi:hypothetical protein